MRVKLSEHVLLADLEDEAVVLNTQSEQYYGLNNTAVLMIKALTETETVEKAHARLRKELDVDEAILNKDLLHLIEQLCARGLLERVSDA